MRFSIRRWIVPICLLSTLGYLYYSSYYESTDGMKIEGKQVIEPQDGLPRIVISGSDLNRNSMSKPKKRQTEIVNESCNIPKLSMYGDDIKKLLNYPNPLNCQKNERNWVYIDENRKITVLEERKNAKCTMRYFDRKSDKENKFEDWIPVENGKEMKEDFAQVKCESGKEKWTGLLASVSKKKPSNPTVSSKDSLDVLMLGVDSMSQMHFRRKMPKTTEFLENVMGSVVLNGYNIVGDGTPQALIPMLTGQTEEELPLTRRRFKNASFVGDVYPFVWSNFSRKGYVTMYAEDMFYAGTFNYRLTGFDSRPTDHYTRPFYKEIEAAKQKMCMGSEPTHKMWFRYASEFLSVYRKQPKFAFMHQGILSHDDLNLVQVQDEDFRDSLKKMHENALFYKKMCISWLLERTVLIVFADHGARFSEIRKTHQGQLEERLPFFSISLPKSIRNTANGKQMLKNLQDNKNRLTSPFDVHATLLDILNPPTSFEEIQKTSERSLSMFRPISEGRSCGQAGIDPHWCTCLSWKNAFQSDEDRNISNIIGRGVARAIDEQIKEKKDICASVKLKEVKSAEKLIPNEGVLKYKSVKDTDGFVPDLSGKAMTSFAYYRLTLVTSPNDAVYEATVFFDSRIDALHMDLSSLSHVSQYGEDPHCIIGNNYFLATFCVCHDRVRS